MNLLFLAVLMTGFAAENEVGSGRKDPSSPQAVSGRARVILPIGGTQKVQMDSRKAIKSVDNPREDFFDVRQIADDPTTIFVRGLKPGDVPLMLTDVDGRQETIEVLIQLDVEYVRVLLQKVVPTGNIIPVLVAKHTLALTGTVPSAEEVDLAMKVAQSFGGIKVINGMRVVGVKQVQLDVMVATVRGNSKSPRSFFRSVVSKVNCGQKTPASPNSFQFGVLENGRGLDGILRVMNGLGLARIIAQPSLVTLSGRPLTLLIDGEPTLFPVESGVTGDQLEPSGARVEFLPVVLGNGKLHLEVGPSVTDLAACFGPPMLGLPDRNRNTNTTVVMNPGQTFVIGGLWRRTAAAKTGGTSLLGPLALLVSCVTSDQDEEVIISVTPHILDPQGAQGSSGNRRPAQQ